ncbi:carbamate kinase [Schaalia sp. 19OD2882]|uniref:carbamate kinase n=1 Tax=Schaalia sp. 19OD2882 TaxID=2794089 RepID=UPI001C1EA4B7|nr:carbamate kinase [Schaalia sp. 19OD2882]QWW19032.1 carbamate kinase [Schaalia sp. 19OD2882]
MGRSVVALGGNALGLTPREQVEALRNAAAGLVDLATSCDGLVVAHGNGPQVGQIERAFSLGCAVDPGVPEIGMPEMVSMSQGYIGDHVVAVLEEEVSRRRSGEESCAGAGGPARGRVAALVTRVRVDEADPAFAHPTKPIGPFLSAEQAERRRAEHPDHVYGQDAGRGWRRMVPSPRPVEIVEVEAVRALVDAGFLTVACGGGGVPVVSDPSRGVAGLRAVDAVIDKDLTAALLAHTLEAETLVICTAVPRVAIGWGTDRQEWLKDMSVARARELIAAGEFAPGSMLPKVLAAVEFVESAPRGEARRAVICALADAGRALGGGVGTLIH